VGSSSFESARPPDALTQDDQGCRQLLPLERRPSRSSPVECRIDPAPAPDRSGGRKRLTDVPAGRGLRFYFSTEVVSRMRVSRARQCSPA
jgi:hypothetical protein